MADTIEEVDKDLVFKVIDKITVIDKGQVIVKLYVVNIQFLILSHNKRKQ